MEITITFFYLLKSFFSNYRRELVSKTDGYINFTEFKGENGIIMVINKKLTIECDKK